MQMGRTMAIERPGQLHPDYPVNLRLTGRKCLVVGGGAVAERKVAALLEAGAAVCVVSPEVTPQLAMWAAEGRLRHEAKEFFQNAVAGCFLVFCATNLPQVNQLAATAAKEAGALVNVADAPALCDFTLPARLVRGNFSITVSTGGESPALARKLRNELNERYGTEYGVYLDVIGKIRREWQASCPASDERCQRWRDIGDFDPEALELLRNGRIKEAEERIRHVVGGFGTQP